VEAPETSKEKISFRPRDCKSLRKWPEPLRNDVKKCTKLFQLVDIADNLLEEYCPLRHARRHEFFFGVFFGLEGIIIFIIYFITILFHRKQNICIVLEG